MKELRWRLNKGKGFLSGIIEYEGHGGYSHIDVVNDRGPVPMLRGARSDWYEDISPGYEDRPLDYCAGTLKRCTQFTLTVSNEQWAAYWRFSDKCLHAPYDTRGLLKSFVLGDVPSRNWRDPTAWWCSEQVARNGEVATLWKLAGSIMSVEPGDCAFLLCGAGAKWEDLPV